MFECKATKEFLYWNCVFFPFVLFSKAGILCSSFRKNTIVLYIIKYAKILNSHSGNVHRFLITARDALSGTQTLYSTRNNETLNTSKMRKFMAILTCFTLILLYWCIEMECRMRINVPSVTRKNIPVDVNLHNPSIRGLACLLNTVVLKTNKQTNKQQQQKDIIFNKQQPSCQSY